jgi:hypothetical protein
MLAAALFVIGAGIVAGAWRGRSVLLVVLAALLLPFVLVADHLDAATEHGVGERTWRPVSAADVRPEYDFGSGHATLDLRDVRLQAGEVKTVQVDMSVGRLDVRLPWDQAYDVVADVDYGSIAVLRAAAGSNGAAVDRDRGDEMDESSFGSHRSAQTSGPALGADPQAQSGTIRIHASLDRGHIDVEHTSDNNGVVTKDGAA